jgi:phage baseplate assembly protein W
MSRLSFKDVGVDYSNRDESLSRRTLQIPIGIKTPVQIDYSGRSFFEMNYQLGDQVADNLKNLILTNWGERVALYNFGANLRPLCFEYSNKEDFDNQAIVRINTAITKWMPFVSPLFYESAIDRTDVDGTIAKVKVTLIYSVPQAAIAEAVIEVTIHVGG